MKTLFMVSYEYHDHLEEDDLRDLTKRFAEAGTPSSVIAHHMRLDGRGGFLLQEQTDDAEPDFELTIRYAPWLRFEAYPVATIEEAFPVIQRVYG